MAMYFNPFPSSLSIILLSFLSCIYPLLFPSFSFTFISLLYFFLFIFASSLVFASLTLILYSIITVHYFFLNASVRPF